MSLSDEMLAASEDESLADELRVLLRRAAERISEAELDAEYLELIREMNEASQQPFGVSEVVKDWLIGHGRLPIEDLDEDSETKGAHRNGADASACCDLPDARNGFHLRPTSAQTFNALTLAAVGASVALDLLSTIDV